MNPDQALRGPNLSTKRNRRRLLQLAIAVGGMIPIASAVATTVASQSAPDATPRATPAGTPIAAATVKMTTQLRFEPAMVTIHLGETVHWINDSPIPHTSTGDPDKNPVKKTRPELAQLPTGAEGWDSGLLNQGQSFSHTFTVAGEYKYFCIPHVLSGMLGTITVQE